MLDHHVLLSLVDEASSKENRVLVVDKQVPWNTSAGFQEGLTCLSNIQVRFENVLKMYIHKLNQKISTSVPLLVNILQHNRNCQFAFIGRELSALLLLTGLLVGMIKFFFSTKIHFFSTSI